MSQGNRSRGNGGGGNVAFLSRNTRPKSDRSPPYNGTAIINGQEYWIGAWTKENQYGPYFHISFTPKDNQGGGKGYQDDRPQRERPQGQNDFGHNQQQDDRGQSQQFDDDIPF